MEFSSQECWSGLPCPPPGNLPDPGIEHMILWVQHCRWIIYCWDPGKPPITSDRVTKWKKKKKKRNKISEKNLKGPLGEHQVKWHLHYMGPRRKWEKEPENWIIYHLKTHFFLSTVCMYKYPSHVPVEYIWWWQWLSLLISMIHFIIFFLLLSLGLLCSSFTDFFTCQIRLIIFYLPFLLM